MAHLNLIGYDESGAELCTDLVGSLGVEVAKPYCGYFPLVLKITQVM